MASSAMRLSLCAPPRAVHGGAWRVRGAPVVPAALRSVRAYAQRSAPHEAPAVDARPAPTFGPFAEHLPYTQLPTPLPMDVRDQQSALRRRALKDATLSSDEAIAAVMSNLDESYYPTARSVETLALLQACLSTGLITRAHKMMTDLRADAHARLQAMHEARQATQVERAFAYTSPLPLWAYNAVLHAYLDKAAHADATEAALWAGRAWDLWDAMLRDAAPRLDPRPDAATVATMAQGVVRLERAERAPADARGVAALLTAVRALGVSLDAVFSSSVLQSGAAAEADAGALLAAFRRAASDVGDAHALRELDGVQQTLAAAAAQDAPAAPADPLAGVAPVRPVVTRGADDTERKPFNLATLQESLAIMHDARARVPDVYERQRWLEHSALDAARKRLQHDQAKLEELGLNAGALQSKTLQAWMWEWYQRLEAALARDLDGLRAQSEAGDAAMEAQLYPFLSLLPPSKLAMIAVLELMRMQGVGGVADGVKTTRALLQVGKAIEAEHHAAVISRHPEVFVQARAAQGLLKDRNLVNLAMRRDLKAWQERCDENALDTQIPKWTQMVRVRVGSYLVQRLMDVATVHRSARDRDGELWEEEQPAFYATYQYISGKKLGVIRLNEVVSRRLDKESVRETLHPRHLPMLVPPKPWLTHDSGGYFSVKTSAMRYKDSIEQSSYLRAASENNGLEVVLAGLDVLGNTAWNINREVFDVVLQVWNSGEALADLPPAETHEPEPARPPPDDIKARGIYLQRMRQWNANRASNHSQRCDINYKLEIARSFLGERFYFPHNMDFRGRAYPIPPHLNHIGNDLCRGLLKFADAKPLGHVGLRWLRIHLANVFGYDKASFAEREQFAIEHEHEVRDAATRPLDGARWWLRADDPWQCLATCIELTKALDHPAGPEHFPSQLPVHQDGTCNGLQHYAALGGDLHGAKQVNLSEGERPSDVYSGVADLVISQLDERAAQGDHYAQLLQGKVTRKVVKQTVMTTVYGVTFVGAKNQVLRQLVDRGDIPAEELWHAASYLAKCIMGCIGDLFSGANLIQEWLSVSARLIAKSIPPERLEAATNTYKPRANARTGAVPLSRLGKEQMTSVIWTTALGLPIVQPYRKVKKHQIATAMQSVYIRDPNQNFEVNPSKQSSAFPPNFIHSLDATHMILTALECQAAGLVFASVHDSYWTHACDIETMSDVIRDTFVRLHSQDILVRLRNEFLERYKGYKIPASSLTKASMMRSERELREAAAHDDAADDATDDADESERKPRRRRAAGDEHKFYDLADVLPPIPEKGNFDVNEIKRSLYFFS
ncbi:DNA-directed RNA polymerase [Malassezia brasiliensis]|uniref:DNA-directed RNA polymerase n=1 Tax=Malassezia brasiliensis TaxID=1821822 RepID=A0AAF0IRN6_9BASI|nr:DNA-directed RNA polymerase [Malassezia brasiliensis]